jgi:hypothetical protein
MQSQFLTPDEVRALIERRERCNAELRAEFPELAHRFPAISDEMFRLIMEKALLRELRRPTLPPLDDDDEDEGPFLTDEELSALIEQCRLYAEQQREKEQRAALLKPSRDRSPS